MLNKIRRIRGYIGQSMRLMVGVPEYSAYLKHMKDAHPDRPILSYEEFFRERQEARYSGKIGRCC